MGRVGGKWSSMVGVENLSRGLKTDGRKQLPRPHWERYSTLISTDETGWN